MESKLLYISIITAILILTAFAMSKVFRHELIISNVVAKSKDPDKVYFSSPSIAKSEDTILVSHDIRSDLKTELLKPYVKIGNRNYQTRIFTSYNSIWKLSGVFPLRQARLFIAGKYVYVFGTDNNLCIARSGDNGVTWSGVSRITDNGVYNQAPCNQVYHNGYIYFAVTKRVTNNSRSWAVSEYSPVVLRGKTDSDLTDKRNWVLSDEFSFSNVDIYRSDYFGIPYYSTDGINDTEIIKDSRYFSPPGWLEPNIIKIYDTRHQWYGDNIFHLVIRSHTGLSNYACLLRVTDRGDTISLGYQQAPSGKNLLYIPFPGGHLKFHIVYDKKTKTYWMSGNISTDSMLRPEHIPGYRSGLAEAKRNMLGLYFSYDCYNWLFAKVIDSTDDERQSRNYPSMIINGKDLNIVVRSGDEDSKNSHDTNIITFHTIENFRNLKY